MVKDGQFKLYNNYWSVVLKRKCKIIVSICPFLFGASHFVMHIPNFQVLATTIYRCASYCLYIKPSFIPIFLFSVSNIWKKNIANLNFTVFNLSIFIYWSIYLSIIYQIHFHLSIIYLYHLFYVYMYHLSIIYFHLSIIHLLSILSIYSSFVDFSNSLLSWSCAFPKDLGSLKPSLMFESVTSFCNNYSDPTSP